MKYPFGKPIFDTKKYIEDIKNIMKSGKLVHGQNIDNFEKILQNLQKLRMQFQFLHVQQVCNFFMKY